MDLRIQKTRRAIKTAFLSLLSGKNLEQITVKELCQTAEISKGTFYLHYRDLFDLSDQLQRDAIRKILSLIDEPMDALDNLDRFMRKLKEALDSDVGISADLLFSGAQRPLFPILLVEEIKLLIFKKNPSFKNDIKINIHLSYHVYGGYYAFMENMANFDSNCVLQTLQEIHNLSQPSHI